MNVAENLAQKITFLQACITPVYKYIDKKNVCVCVCVCICMYVYCQYNLNPKKSKEIVRETAGAQQKAENIQEKTGYHFSSSL